MTESTEADNAKEALHNALAGIQPYTPDIEKAIELLANLPADQLTLVVALMESVRQAGYEDGSHDGYEQGCKDERGKAQRADTPAE